jgi:O-antigen/teichoic acid export membrane protein
MSIERQVVAGLKWSAAGKLIAQTFSWIVTLVVVRLLSPDDYGLMALGGVIVTTIAAVAELGLGASLVQAKDISRDELARVAGTLTVINFACALALVLVAPLLAELFALEKLADVVRVCALQFVLNAIDAVPQSMAYRQMRFKWLTAVDLGAALVTSVITLALAIAGAGVWALVIGSVSGGAVRSALLVTQGTAVMPEFALRGMSHHLRFGGAVTVSRVLWQLAHQFDVMIAGRVLTQEAVGVYVVALQLANIPVQKAMSVVNQVAFSTISRLQGELPRLRTRLLEAIRLLFFVGIPILWGVSSVAPEFVEVLLGERWLAAVFPLQVASIIAPLRMLSAVLSTAIAGVGRADLDLRNTLVVFVIFPVAFVCGVHWNVDGLAAAWVAAVPITFAINWPRTWRTLGIDLHSIFSASRAPVIAGLAMYATVWAGRLAMNDQSALVRFPILAAAGAAVYLALVSILDRTVWTDLRRLLSALRG